MKKVRTKGKKRSIIQYEMLEECIRKKAQEFIQEVFEEEINEFLGRVKSERIKLGIDVGKGYRNGYGKPRRLGHDEWDSNDQEAEGTEYRGAI